MAEKKINIPKEKFAFVNEGERISDKKFADKPVGYFRDAWIRFRKSKASVVAAMIIICIMLYSFLMPLIVTSHDAQFMCSTYAKKPGRITWLRDFGIVDGGVDRTMDEASYIKLLAMAVAAEGQNGEVCTLGEAMDSAYQVILKAKNPYTQEMPNGKLANFFPAHLDTYLEVGFVYQDVEQDEYARILAWQEETGIPVLYPLIDTQNGYCFNEDDANYWYKTKLKGTGKGMPVSVNENGKATVLEYSEDLVLEDNYLRDGEGNLVYHRYTGGGDVDTAQFRIRVLYYNYYQYLYGSTPDYIFGTDSEGYDLALRIADGIQLSLLLAVCVSAINFIIGAAYGAVEGYYGGATDIILCRITEILSGVPFIIVATLFQLHWSDEAGPVGCLLFAYVLTG